MNTNLINKKEKHDTSAHLLKIKKPICGKVLKTMVWTKI
jgi:hypothetical protein